MKIKYWGHGNYDNGSLSLHLKRDDVVDITPDTFTKLKADLGIVRFRSEVEILSPAKMRNVSEYFK